MNQFKADPRNQNPLPYQLPDARYGCRHSVLADVDWIETLLMRDYSRSVLCASAGDCALLTELARRGYCVTWIDLTRSVRPCGQTREINPKAGVEVIHCRVERLNLVRLESFDLCITAGVFSMLERDDQDLFLLRQLAGALKPGGTLLMTALNAAFLLTSRPQALNPCTRRGLLSNESGEQSKMCGSKNAGQRWYTELELNWLLNHFGLQPQRFFAVSRDELNPFQSPAKDCEALGVLAVKRSNNSPQSE